MVRSLDEMATKGKGKLKRKGDSMKKSYNAAKERMKTNFGKMPFGPTRTKNYKDGVDAATYIPPDADKWATNWKAKMAE